MMSGGSDTTNFISVCIIGSLTNELQALRGLKQGDCFVPFLFTVVVEGMPGLMHKAEEGNLFNGFFVNDNLIVPPLQFTDDTMILCDGGENILWCLKVIP